jgi:hypothetical protein
MTRVKFLFAAVVVAAIVALVAVVPAAQAQTIHFVGAGSSAQFNAAAVAADQAACVKSGQTTPGTCSSTGGTGTIKHWTKKYSASTNDGAYLSDSRNSAIVDQTGNVWVVWIESSTGATTDVWLDVSVDSTVGNRCVLAQETNGSGCQVQITSAYNAAGAGLINQPLWPDNTADAPLDSGIWNAINTSISGGVHVNVGLTDIRPEDSEYATKERLICTAARGTTNTCLGDELVANVGGDINTSQGTGSFAQPVAFSLPGEDDPFNKTLKVPTTFITYEIGAAPVVFIENNGGTGPFPLNLVSGVTPDLHATGQKYPLANLFDGSTSCDTNNLALGGTGTTGGTPLTVFLREPLSGTMNTTEFSVFRTFDNADDTQEGANGGAAMPFSGSATTLGANNAPCTGNGARSRAIGTGEVIGGSNYGVLGIPNSLGYVFTGWANFAKYKGSSTYQYLTLDGVDPIFAAPTAYSVCVGGASAGQVCGTAEPCATGGTCTAGGSANQVIPYCNSTNCTSDLWDAYTDAATGYTVPAGVTFPNIRNGLYKAWTIYRWVTTSTSDPYGPSLVSQEAQNYVDGQIADFIPFAACAPGTGSACLSGTPTDGLAVYRSHFKPTGVTEVCPSTSPNNGSASNANNTDGGNSLGGGDECAGDVGGLINGGTQAAFGTNSPTVTYATWKDGTATKNKGWEVTWKNGDHFDPTADAVGQPVTLVCTNNAGVQTVTNTTVEYYLSTLDIYVSVPNPGPTDTIACRVQGGNITHNPISGAGVLSKKQ